MKISLPLSLLLSVMALSVNGQRTTYIRFRHIGEETKPIGTLTICFREAVAPLDSGLNSQFGKTVIIDTFTYQTLKKFINTSKKVVYDKKGLSFRSGTFEILMKDKPYGYLNDDKSDSFFRNLIQYLKERKGDKKIIKFLDLYINKSPPG